MTSPILILPTDTPLPAATKKLMTKKGIVVLYMDDPSKAVTLHLAPVVHADLVTRAALEAIRTALYGNVRETFGKLLAEMAVAATTP